jgi:hypothetical protein
MNPLASALTSFLAATPRTRAEQMLANTRATAEIHILAMRPSSSSSRLPDFLAILY